MPGKPSIICGGPSFKGDRFPTGATACPSWVVAYEPGSGRSGTGFVRLPRGDVEQIHKFIREIMTARRVFNNGEGGLIIRHPVWRLGK